MKILKRIIGIIAIIAILIGGKIQLDKYQVKRIAHGEEGKVAIENMLRELDEKALTSEGKIKSYKIDDSYTKKNPMGGIDINIILNNDSNLILETTINKYSSQSMYEHGSLGMTQELDRLLEN